MRKKHSPLAPSAPRPGETCACGNGRGRRYRRRNSRQRLRGGEATRTPSMTRCLGLAGADPWGLVDLGVEGIRHNMYILFYNDSIYIIEYKVYRIMISSSPMQGLAVWSQSWGERSDPRRQSGSPRFGSVEVFRCRKEAKTEKEIGIVS